MCCIFTCCGWMIDLIQRVWVFAMSCCISSAVCCVLITSSMSGVALGYNYSLAEYIDTKETNVSVYVKRGVFDDEIGEEDSDWRRRGHQPIRGFVRDEGNLKTASPDDPEQMPLEVEQSGRRLEDSILESDSNNKFEGHLMKLTVSPPHPSTTTTGVTSDFEMVQAMSPFPQGSLDQLKAIQGIINKRKSTAKRDATVTGMSTYNFDERNLVHAEGYPGKIEDELQGRRMMHVLGRNDILQNLKDPSLVLDPDTRRQFGARLRASVATINPARLAVPDGAIGSELNWKGPKLPPDVFYKFVDPERHFGPTYPSPPPYRTGPIRPIISSSAFTPKPSTLRIAKPDQPADERQQDRISEGREDLDKIGKESFMKPVDSMIAKTESSDYYEEENVRGLPVRKKRSINPVRAKQLPRAKFASKELPHKINPASLTKFKVGKSVFNEINDNPSVLVSKLHFSNVAESKETSTNEQVVMNSNKTAQVKVTDVKITLKDTVPILDSSNDKVLRIIRSMFS